MSTELDIEQAAADWIRDENNWSLIEDMNDEGIQAGVRLITAFHKHMLAIASLPQQDVGAGRYEVGDMVVFTDSAWVFRPNEDIGAHPNARNPRRVLAPPDRHGHFRIDGTDVDYATGIWVGSDEITLHSRAAVRSVPSPVGQEPVAWTKEDLSAIITQSDRIASIEDGGALRVMAEKFTIPLFTHPPKAGVLTDEEIERIADRLYPIKNFSPGPDIVSTAINTRENLAAKATLRHVRYLSPKP